MSQKIEISDEQFDINLKFYFFLKHLVKEQLTDKQCFSLIEKIQLFSETPEAIPSVILEWKEQNLPTKGLFLIDCISFIKNNVDCDIFLFSIRIYLIKGILLDEAKVKKIDTQEELKKYHPLSIQYEKCSLITAYTTRIEGALLSLKFFERLEKGQTNFLSKKTENLLQELLKTVQSLIKLSLQPNQIFMLVFSESIAQSDKSRSGSNYEDRIKAVLCKIGIPHDQIKKVHDSNDKSTEFDFFFDLNGRTYGIGAKRTLRERYKQFIKTTHTSQIDVFIEITLGTDLNREKAETILKHGTVLFIADEIYDMRTYFKEMIGIYPVRELTIETLKKL